MASRERPKGAEDVAQGAQGANLGYKAVDTQLPPFILFFFYMARFLVEQSSTGRCLAQLYAENPSG